MLIVDGTGWTGKIIDLVHIKRYGINDVMVKNFKIGIIHELEQVLFGTSEKIIEA
jgi:hypothetical protein